MLVSNAPGATVSVLQMVLCTRTQMDPYSSVCRLSRKTFNTPVPAARQVHCRVEYSKRLLAFSITCCIFMQHVRWCMYGPKCCMT